MTLVRVYRHALFASLLDRVSFGVVMWAAAVSPLLVPRYRRVMVMGVMGRVGRVGRVLARPFTHSLTPLLHSVPHSLYTHKLLTNYSLTHSLPQSLQKGQQPVVVIVMHTRHSSHVGIRALPLLALYLSLSLVLSLHQGLSLSPGLTSTSTSALVARPPPRLVPAVDTTRMVMRVQKNCESCILSYRGDYYPDTTFFHLHIPKTGGSTFAQCLRCWDNRKLLMPTAPLCNCKEFNVSDDFLKVLTTKNKQVISCEISSGVPGPGNLNTFLAKLSIPSIKVLTFIRKPIDHVMSAFLHMKSRKKHTSSCSSFKAIFESYENKKKKNCTHYDIRNMQTASLSLSSFANGNTNLTAAVSFLSERVFFFGITSYYRTSLCLLAYQLGQLELHRSVCDCSTHAHVSVKHANVYTKQSSNSPAFLDELSIEDMKTLTSAYINLDNVLYHVAMQVFLQRVLIAEQDSGQQLLCEAVDGEEVMTLKASISNPRWNNKA